MIKTTVAFAALIGLASALPAGTSTSTYNPEYKPFDIPNDELQRLVNFLTNRVTYPATALNNIKLPLSFYTPVDYYGKYICNEWMQQNGTGKTCEIEQSNDQDPGYTAQIERINMHTGSNIYDASCWQMAVALSGSRTLNAELTQLSKNPDKLLASGHFGDQKDGELRASSRNQDPQILFNGVFYDPSVDPDKYAKKTAFAYRMVPKQYLTIDPFKGTPYEETYLKSDAAGNVAWQDWKAIAGENSWAFYIGPLQALYLRTFESGERKCDASILQDPAIQNARDVLNMVATMQAPQLGAILYSPSGIVGNSGVEQLDGTIISTENNASMLGGLLIFMKLLDKLVADGCVPADNEFVKSTKWILQGLVYGGYTDQSGNWVAIPNHMRGYYSKGLLNFFKDHAWDAENEVFYTSGNMVWDRSITIPTAEQVQYVPDPLSAQAVDVVTWTIATLGANYVDKEIGTLGTSYRSWTKTKEYGHFRDNTGKLLGVGYSNKDEHKILSGEWTFGAMNLMQHLISFYESVLNDPLKDSKWVTKTGQRLAALDQLPKIIDELKKDLNEMSGGVQEVRLDVYKQSTMFNHVKPTGYNEWMNLGQDQNAYLYASQRYLIPFGWYSNPVPSTTSTSWAIYVHYKFNPFNLGGSMTTDDYWTVNPTF